MSSSHLTALPRGYRLQEYELESVLGQGTFGITYKALDTHSHRHVAIKEYFPREFSARDKGSTVLASGSRADVDSFEWGLTRFVDEAKTLARFDHPNLIAVRRFFQSNGTAYLVMDYCDGEPLDTILERDITLDEERIMKFLKPLLDGLELVHATDVIHRDIKPGNIFIKSDGTPVLLDFGAARQDMSSHSRSVTSLATPGYAAVEQYATRGRLGPWSDIYGLGATLYRCVTGVKPQGALDRQLEDELEPASKLAKGKYSANLLNAIDWSLGVRPEQRPQSIKLWREKLFSAASSFDEPVKSYTSPVMPAVQDSTAQAPLVKGVVVSPPSNKPLIIATVAVVAIAFIFLLAKAFNKPDEPELVFGSDTNLPARPVPEEAAPAAPAAPETEAPIIAVPPEKQYVTNFTYGDGVYTGQIIGGVPNGKGEYYATDGRVDKGRFVDGYLSGKGTRAWSTGQKHIGNFVNGGCTGFGTTHYPGGTRFEAMWVDCGTGEGTYFEKDGSSWARSCRDTTCTSKSVEAAPPVVAVPSEQYVTNFAYRGGTYTGTVIDGIPNGKGEYRWGDGTLDKGNFVQGVFNGKGTRLWTTGNKYIGQFVNNICSGDGVRFFKEGSKYEAKFIDCNNADGTYTLSDGTVSRSKLIDGKWNDY